MCQEFSSPLRPSQQIQVVDVLPCGPLASPVIYACLNTHDGNGGSLLSRGLPGKQHNGPVGDAGRREFAHFPHGER